MKCKKTLCQECATQWDGIWYCATCLASRRAGTTRRSPLPGWLALVALTVVILFLSARTMVWVGALVAGWF